MKNEKTIKVSSWHELVDFIENMNPYENTLVLSGFVNRLFIDKTFIESLYFTVKPVGILKENGKQSKSKRVSNGSKRKGNTNK